MPETQPTEPTSEPELLKVVGQIGGPTQAVAVQGDYAYVGVGLRLVVLDVSAPTTPREVGATEPFEWYVEDVAVSSDTAYVAAGGEGLYIVDISDPAHPAVLGVHDTTGYAEGVAIAGEYAYIADGPMGLLILDISDPTRPLEVGTAYSLSYAFDVAMQGHYAYLAAAGAGLLVVDITNPVQPVEVGFYKTPGYAYAITLSDGEAHIASGWEGLSIVDITDPRWSKLLSTYDTPGWAFDVVTVGDTAYIADAFGGLCIIDVSYSTKPTELGSCRMPDSHASGLAVDGGVLYLADRNVGLQVIDISSGTQPVQVGLYSPMGYADDVAVVGDYAYVAAGPYGLRVVNVSDPYHPREVGSYDTEGYALSIDAVDNYAYVGTTHGLYIVDVSNPSHPSLASFHDFEDGGPMQDIVVSHGTAYIANEWGLGLIDVSDPHSPTDLNFLAFHDDPAAATKACTWGVAVSGNTAYVTDGSEGLKIVDVSDPHSAAIVGSYRTTTVEKVLAVTVAGNFAYVTDHPRMHIVNISDSKNPTEAGFYDMPIKAERVAFFEGIVYAADGGVGLLAVDVTKPQSPTLIGSCVSTGYALGLTVSGRYVYVADGDGGLFIVEDLTKSRNASTSSSAQPMIPPKWNKTIVSFADRFTTYGNAVFQRASGQDRAPVQSQLTALSSSAHLWLDNVDSSAGAGRLTVTSVTDSGSGTLRWALENASSGDIITFDPTVFPPESPTAINLTSQLPWLWQGGITIDASNAGVILDGSSTPPYTQGLCIDSDNNVIRGLQIVHFSSNGVSINKGAKYNIIGGDRNKGNGPLGEGNLISENGYDGVQIVGEGTTNNRVIGNFIGTDLTGTRALPNKAHGVYIGQGASHNVIGGTTPADRNIISGNARAEVSLMRQANGNSVVGNYIGTDASGGASLGNAFMGVSIELGAFNNIIKCNVISSNGSCVIISDWGSHFNQVIGNFIGVDATGTIPLGGAGGGIGVNASFNKIGGTTPAERNIVSGNGGKGIRVGWLGVTDAIIIGNYIGTDVSGTRGLGNGAHGILLTQGTRHSFVGGMTEGERNVISSNRDSGINLECIGVRYNLVGGNFVGTDVTGTASLPNQWGITINYAEHNFVQRNIIAYNQKLGILINAGKGNLIFHNNLIDNTNNASDSGCSNYWHNRHEGNYWSDYEGKDTDGDGIGDIPYRIAPNGVDNYPLMDPYGQ